MVLSNNESNRNASIEQESERPDRAMRLATVLLEQNSGEGFEVQFFDAEQGEQVGHALVRLGCLVEFDELGTRLAVAWPGQREQSSGA